MQSPHTKKFQAAMGVELETEKMGYHTNSILLFISTDLMSVIAKTFWPILCNSLHSKGDNSKCTEATLSQLLVLSQLCLAAVFPVIG